jgi:hypothetical protein
MRFFQRVTGIYTLSPFRSTYQLPLKRGRERSHGVINDPFYFKDRIFYLAVENLPCQVRIVIIFMQQDPLEIIFSRSGIHADSQAHPTN